MKAIHSKTGNEYLIDDVIINTSSNLGNDEKVQILYHNNTGRFVKEAHEFFEKFDLPDGLNILSHLCTSVLEQVKVYEDAKANRVECISNDKKDKLSLDYFFEDDEDEEPNDEDETSVDNIQSEEIIPIDNEVFDSYKFEKREIREGIKPFFMRTYARRILEKGFNHRYQLFKLIRYTYDNATSDYFVVGYNTNNDYREVVQISKETYEDLVGIYAAEVI